MVMDWGLLARAVVALAIVLALITGVSWFARRYLGSSVLGGFAGTRRLTVVEQAVLDGRSRLVLVRRDDVEHLLVIGQSGATVVETGIRSAGENGIATPADARQSATADPASRTNLRTLFRIRQ